MEKKQNIMRHLRTKHTPPERHVCQVCDKEFKNYQSLYDHNRRRHQDKTNRLRNEPPQNPENFPQNPENFENPQN